MIELTIALVVLTVIILRTVAAGGDWSDVMVGEARYNNWCNNFDFNLMFICLGFLVIGAIGYFALTAFKEQPPNQVIGKASHHSSQRPKKVFIQDLDPTSKPARHRTK